MVALALPCFHAGFLVALALPCFRAGFLVALALPCFRTGFLVALALPCFRTGFLRLRRVRVFFSAVCGLLIEVASLVVAPGSRHITAVVAARGF